MNQNKRKLLSYLSHSIAKTPPQIATDTNYGYMRQKTGCILMPGNNILYLNVKLLM